MKTSSGGIAHYLVIELNCQLPKVLVVHPNLFHDSVSS